MAAARDDETAWWSGPEEDLLAALGTSRDGLDPRIAAERLLATGPNRIDEETRLTAARLLGRQFASPLVLILLFGAVISLSLGEYVDAAIILAIVVGSALLGFTQEYRASQAVAGLRRRLALTSRVRRGGAETEVPSETLVPGDVLLLSAGNLVPADGRILSATDFLVAEASLTGETFPVEKRPGTVPAAAALSARSNGVFMGGSVRSGDATVLVVDTGRRTAFGAIGARIARREPETDFDRGIRRFGGLLLRVMLLIVVAVFAINQMIGRPLADSLLFAVALAVGLSPELLPAIVSVTLSAGARRLAAGGVIVRRLEAIENLGSIDVLCTDKTGTLTEGDVVLREAVDPAGAPSPAVGLLAFVNAALETGIANPLDAAIVAAGRRDGLDVAGLRKVDEIPYDFERRRLTIVVEEAAGHRLVVKGAVAEVLAVCTTVAVGDAVAALDEAARAAADAYFRRMSEAGYRVLAVADRLAPAKADWTRDDEAGLTLRGFLLFADPPKPEAVRALADLAALGIAVKVITGDNRFVAAHVAREVGLDPAAMLTGEALAAMRDEALWHAAPRTTLFVEIDPQQKERIVRALQRTGHAVGYLGDGINDAPALHAADVGISVDGAVDVARESADVVLLQRDLDVLRQGVEGGRRAFANTLKYISITTSANFGNMVSMALATPLLPFLPLLPKQILLNNFLSDLPSMAISTDRVDADQVLRPQRWDIAGIRRFMIVFGLISSLFDLLTFAVLLATFGADETVFRTAWFVVSLMTELSVVLVLRTRGPAVAGRPSAWLGWSTAAVLAATLALPYAGPLAAAFGFAPLSLAEMASVLAIVAGYVVVTEAAKAVLWRKAREG